MIVDASTIDQGRRLVADVCVIGAGPAGLAIARRLEGSGLKVLLLESGGRRPSVAGQKLNRGLVTGQPYWPLHSTRVRALGGTGNRWAGWCRPLDAVDVEHRDWVPDSGWPMPYSEMERFHEDASRFLQLPERSFRDPRESTDDPGWSAGEASGLEPVYYRFSPLTSLGLTYLDELDSSADTTVVLHATVSDLRLEPGTSRIGTVEVGGPGNRAFVVEAGQVVLAAGGLENPRLLLSARTDRPAGLGNEHDSVGRYFMEHLHAEVGVIHDGDPALRTPFFDWSAKSDVGRGAVAGAAEVQRSEQLLPISFTVAPTRRHFGQRQMRMPPSLGVPYRRALTRVPRVGWMGKEVARRISRSVPVLARTAQRLTPGGQPDLRYVHARSEQVPRRDSRVLLGDARDSLGRPVVRLDWRLDDQDLANVRSWVERLAAAVDATAGARFVPTPLTRANVIGGPHHMGTTRMSADPRRGVVDADCRVHSVDNLYVTGSSVFATGGYANPTYPLVALALRLADHLRARAVARVRVVGPEATAG